MMVVVLLKRKIDLKIFLEGMLGMNATLKKLLSVKINRDRKTFN